MWSSPSDQTASVWGAIRPFGIDELEVAPGLTRSAGR
jgi:hypothetical protein